MADHVQDQILSALKQRLVAAGTAAGDRVFLERVDELPASKLPAIEIEAGDEDIAPPSGPGWPRLQERVLFISIRVTVGGATAEARRLAAGNLAKQVEMAIAESQALQQLGGLAKHGVHLQRSSVEKDGKADPAFYCINQTWGAGYRTRANAPDVAV